ncbi:hypothetical protein [Paenibacillus agilis]|uniref:Uncharacterized protein n=1 Tax=Paenibacillus agilis TaxID=3020863 RepID=A0A559IVQ0_9BACL|nr:hypothetical protein [Paenibacillus agilis]TVX91718.1 hypothetical protein FPZ44_00780 [Paenibacillus agilis]
MRRVKRSAYHRAGMLCAMLIMSVMLFCYPAPSAQAGLWDWMEGISEMPKEFNELKGQYDQMEQSLKDSQQRYHEMTDKLNGENDQLRKQNEELMNRLLLLEEQELKQKQQVRRIFITIATAVGLLMLYFVMTRVMRVMVWSRHRSR